MSAAEPDHILPGECLKALVKVSRAAERIVTLRHVSHSRRGGRVWYKAMNDLEAAVKHLRSLP